MPLVNRAPKPTDVVVQVYLREGEAEGHLQAQGHQETLQGAAYEGGGRGCELTPVRRSYVKDCTKAL